ncbi:hypothetical protein D3C78_1188900 [compost metagenome]
MFAVGVSRAPHRVGGGVFPGGLACRGQLATEKVVEGDEIIVLAGIGNGAVELDVGGGCRSKVAAFVEHLLQGFVHARQVRCIAALGRHRGGLGLDPQTHFEHLHQVGAAALCGREAEHRAGGCLRNIRTQAAAGDQHPIRLELGYGFAHHRAADVQLFGQLLLGGQARFGRQASGIDLCTDGTDDAFDQRVRALKLKHGV